MRVGVGKKHSIARSKRRSLVDPKRFADEEDAGNSGDAREQADKPRFAFHHRFFLCRVLPASEPRSPRLPPARGGFFGPEIPPIVSTSASTQASSDAAR